ncbi:MAG: hypothetical protein DBX42_09195 [Azospirillum sp.]|nr:MAG: hypothetical protein DBX42_09195 [Azospirillum sp.]
MNLIQYISQADPEDKIVSKKNSPWNNAKNWYNEYGKVNKLADNKVTDENKHQYMSCLAGKGGKLEATGGWTTGLLKEAYDLTKKSASSETRKRYGGIGNIFKDSVKDIVNNWKGLQYGLENRGKCINLLERKLP